MFKLFYNKYIYYKIICSTYTINLFINQYLNNVILNNSYKNKRLD